MPLHFKTLVCLQAQGDELWSFASSCPSALKSIAVRDKSPFDARNYSLWSGQGAILGKQTFLLQRLWKAVPIARCSAPAGRGKHSPGAATGKRRFHRAGLGQRPSHHLPGLRTGHWRETRVAGSKRILGVYQVHLQTTSGCWVLFWLCSLSSSAGNCSPAVFPGAALLRSGQSKNAALTPLCVLTRRSNVYTEYSSNCMCEGRQGASQQQIFCQGNGARKHLSGLHAGQRWDECFMHS